MGLHSFLLLMGGLYVQKRRVRILNVLCIVMFFIIAFCNIQFAIDHKPVPEEITRLNKRVPWMSDKYIIVNTWNSPIVVYFSDFFYNPDAK